MELKQLRYFVQVAELGSFAKASDVLDVPQPTLSRQIRALELDLKTSLLHRHGRGVVPTAAGARFLEQAHGVLHAADAAVQVVQTKKRLTGHVACGMTPSIGRKTIAEYVRRFNAELPEATLAISNQVSVTLQEQLGAARLDFAVTYDPIPSPNIDITLLRQQGLFVIGRHPIGAPAETVGLAQLKNIPLILPSRIYAVRRALELAGARLGVFLHIRSEVDVLEAIFDLVADGLGSTVATEGAIASLNQQEGLSVQRLVSPEITIDLALITPLQRGLTPLQKKATELARIMIV